MNATRESNVDYVEIAKLIHVVSIVGEGVENDPVRRIDEYYSIDGLLLFRLDSWKNEQAEKAVP